MARALHRIPPLDHLRRTALVSPAGVRTQLGLDPQRRIVLVAYHPVTLARDTLYEADALFAALAEVDGPVIFSHPNADAGGRNLVESARHHRGPRGMEEVFVNLDPLTYWSLLRHVALFVGNSSSGIMETASFALPAVVDVGLRQQGRERPRNVIDAEADTRAVLDAVTRAPERPFPPVPERAGESPRRRPCVREDPRGPLDRGPGPGPAHETGHAPRRDAVTPLRITPLPPPTFPTPRRGGCVQAGWLRTPHLSLGPKVAEFETALAASLGSPQAVAVSSGTAASTSASAPWASARATR